MRIAKFIARCGLYSRRKAEEVISASRVTVNKEVVTELSTKISQNDTVCVDGKKLHIADRKIILYHKREGLITTRHDPQDRPTIYDDLDYKYQKFITVGRLDKYTEGLIILTNDGEFARSMELPENGFKRKYRVKVFGNIDRRYFKELADGITIDDIHYKSIKVKILSQSANNSWLEIELIEGKNREIRNICKFFSWSVVKLIRISYGPYKLGNLKVGELQKIKVINHD